VDLALGRTKNIGRRRTKAAYVALSRAADCTAAAATRRGGGGPPRRASGRFERGRAASRRHVASVAFRAGGGAARARRRPVPTPAPAAWPVVSSRGARPEGAAGGRGGGALGARRGRSRRPARRHVGERGSPPLRAWVLYRSTAGTTSGRTKYERTHVRARSQQRSSSAHADLLKEDAAACAECRMGAGEPSRYR